MTKVNRRMTLVFLEKDEADEGIVVRPCPW